MRTKPTRDRYHPKQLLRVFVVKCLSALPPDKVLQHLFRLDQWLYYLQGQISIVYGRGIHTKHRHIGYHDFFIGRIHPGEKVLDIGCGVGAVTYSVAEKAQATVLGIDISPKNIIQAQLHNAHSRVEYIVGDALQVLPNRTFDVVILSNFLEHLPERPTFIRKVQQVAHPSRLLLRVPLFERDWRVPLKRELGVEWRLDPTHEIEYTIESFAEEMAESGMEISYQEIRWGEIWAEVVPTNS